MKPSVKPSPSPRPEKPVTRPGRHESDKRPEYRPGRKEQGHSYRKESKENGRKNEGARRL